MLRTLAFGGIAALAIASAAVVAGVGPSGATTNGPSGSAGYCTSSTRGDFDGDGRQDVARLSGCHGVWRVAIRLATGLRITRSLAHDALPGLEEHAMCLAYCTAWGAHDLNGDRRDELEIADDTPAAGVIVAAYRLVGKSLQPLKVRRAGGLVVMPLSYTASVTLGSWVVCRNTKSGRLVVQVSEAYALPPSHRTRIHEDIYHVRGDLFQHVAQRSYTRRAPRAGSPVRVAGTRC